ncbi:hypothetical protein ACFL3J_03360 [Candidatus Omnitrophota bacterium]
MTPSRHIIASLALGAIFWFFAKSFYAGLLCFASGVFSDADHFIEYMIHFGWKGLSYKNVYYVSQQTQKRVGNKRFNKLYIVFHIGEIAILLWVLVIWTRNIYLLAIATGYTVHLIIDTLGNRGYPRCYFLLGRFISGFDTDKLLRPKKT